MTPRYRYFFQMILLAIGLLLLVACGTLEVGMDQDAAETVQVVATVTAGTVVPETTAEPSPSPVTPASATPEVPATASQTTATAEPEPSRLWATYRDAGAGFGYAFPCQWVHQGTTVASYDEAFFMNHSIKGQWTDGYPPDGALKMEIAAFAFADSGIAPGTPLEEAVPMAISGDFVSNERVVLGGREALRVDLSGTVYAGETTNEMYFFPMGENGMLLFSVIPRSALNSADVQAVLDSLALAEEEPIAMPAADPQGTLEGRQMLADEAAGYCFQYPAEYSLEAYPPSGIPYLGDIVTLKLERPFYTLGLTATALRVGQESSLDEWVSQYIQGLPDGGAQVTRNPQERIGGVDFQIGGEPAEFLEGVPGDQGSRDIMVKHGDRLYRLSFVPSTAANPQAAPELESLFLVVTTSFSFLPQQN